MINLQNLTLIRGDRTLLDDVSLTFHAKQKIGLVGANGSGKSSLISLIRKLLPTTLGEISYNDKLRISHVAQETPADSCSALTYVLKGDKALYALEQRMHVAEKKEDYNALANLHADYELLNGYTAKSRAQQLLHYLGFSYDQQEKPVTDFSGGWRMRLNLAQALFTPADLLLLDEPTNHLDLEAIIMLEKWLQDYPGTIILISHDREFLDKTVTHIAHLHQQTIKLYAGNYSTFENQRALDLALQQASYEKQQAKIKHMMKFVDRFRAKATKAKQAQSRLKAIEKMDKVAAVQAESSLQFEFFEPDTIANPLLTLKDVSLGYGETSLLEHINLQLLKGDRIGIIGHNGAGKSTLIKAITGSLPLQSGEMHIASKLKVGYFAQHQLEYLTLENSPLQHMQELAENEPIAKLRNYLGGFGFSGDMALNPIKNLSGGEKSRLSLAMLIWQKPGLLLMDEPTNHLDLDMRMALTLALQNYSGALLLISHDRYLMNTLADKLLLVHGGKVTEYNQSLEDYQQLVLSTPNPSTKPKEKKSAPPKEEKNRKINPRKIEIIEQEMQKCKEHLAKIETALCDSDLFNANNTEKYQDLLSQQKQYHEQLARLEEQWFQASGLA